MRSAGKESRRPLCPPDPNGVRRQEIWERTDDLQELSRMSKGLLLNPVRRGARSASAHRRNLVVLREGRGAGEGDVKGAAAWPVISQAIKVAAAAPWVGVTVNQLRVLPCQRKIDGLRPNFGQPAL